MISAVVLSHNDENCIKACLAGLLWCDERILIDDFSTDKTVTIAKTSGARVYERHLDDDFAAQRNFGLAKAKNDWILFVDSDEVVTKELADEIKTILRTHPPAGGSNPRTQQGFFVKRKDFIFGKWLNHGETSRVRLLRLAKKGTGNWERPVHEIWNIKGEIGELSNPLEHFPHPNVAQFIEDINRYSTLNAGYLYKQNITVHWWQIAGYPAAKFFLNYFWYLGFLDGTAGATVAILMSFHSFLSRAKLWQLQDKAS